MYYVRSYTARVDPSYPTRGPNGDCVSKLCYMADIYFWDQHRWAKYGHVNYSSRKAAEAFLRRHPLISSVDRCVPAYPTD